MKKIYLSVVALILALSLCGCGIQDMVNEFLATEPTAPEQELNGILEALDGLDGGISLAVHTDDGDIYGPYALDELPELDTAVGRPVEEPSGLGRYDNWLVLTAGDGEASLTVYVGNRDMLCLEEDGAREFFRDESSSLARPLRRCFDALEFESLTFRVMPVVPTPSGALREYASNAYPEIRKELAPGSVYGFRDYDLMEYGIVESTDTTLTGTFTYAALPDAEDSVLYDQGRLLTEAPHEGYVLITETVTLERHEDGYWYQVNETDPAE